MTGRTDANLDAAHAQVAAEISRTDAKAALMLAFNGAAFAGLLVTAGAHLPAAATVLGAVAAFGLVAATALLLLVVRPNIGCGERNGFLLWAEMTCDDELREALSGDSRPGHVRVLSKIAVRKYTALRRAVDATLASLALLTVAALLAIG